MHGYVCLARAMSGFWTQVGTELMLRLLRRETAQMIGAGALADVYISDTLRPARLSDGKRVERTGKAVVRGGSIGLVIAMMEFGRGTHAVPGLALVLGACYTFRGAWYWYFGYKK